MPAAQTPPPKDAAAPRPAPRQLAGPADAAAPRGKMLFPGENEWEVWACGSSQPLLTAPRAEDLPLEGVTEVALPAHSVLCLPLWLETTDEKLFPDLVRLQLEKLGLVGKGEPWVTTVLTAADGRTLVAVEVLLRDPDAASLGMTQAAFAASPHFLPMPADGLMMWRELGAVVFALSLAERPVIYRALPWPEVNADVVQEMRATVLWADAQGWISGIRSVQIAGRFSREEVQILQENFDVPVTLHPRPAPRPPAGGRSELTPLPVAGARAAASRRRRWRRGIVIAASAYFLLLAGWIGYVGWLSWRASSLQAEFSEISPLVTRLRADALLWETMAPALDPRRYPLEILYQCSRLLPEQGVRLTLLEIREDKIFLTGEAASTRAAFDYIEAVTGLPELNFIQWQEPPQPAPLPNNSARFQLEGTITGGLPHASP